MITFLLITSLVISLALNVATIIIIQNLNRRATIYEQWILEAKNNVGNSLALMREIDKQGVFSTSINDKGVFESDDHVGQIFKELTGVIEKLNDRTQ